MQQHLTGLLQRVGQLAVNQQAKQQEQGAEQSTGERQLQPADDGFPCKLQRKQGCQGVEHVRYPFIKAEHKASCAIVGSNHGQAYSFIQAFSLVSACVVCLSSYVFCGLPAF